MTEYAIVFSVVAAAVIGMQLFVKRGLQAKVKDVSNYYTNQTGGVAIGTTAQYEPYYTAAGTLTTATTNKPYAEAMSAGGKIARTSIDDTTTRTGSTTQAVDLATDDNWK